MTTASAFFNASNEVWYEIVSTCNLVVIIHNNMDTYTVNLVGDILYNIMPTTYSAGQQDQLLDIVFGEKTPILCDFLGRLTLYQSIIYWKDIN